MIELKGANYKGVDLTFIDSSAVGGNRLVKYNFPNSNKQSIEIQGQVPRSFSMTLVIPHEDYYAVKKNTIRVLEDGVKGTFVHPTYGDIEDIINGEYLLTEKITELGKAEITVTFEKDDAPGIPITSDALPAKVAQQNLQVKAQLFSDLEEGYVITPNATNSVKNHLSQFEKMVAKFEEVSNLLNSPAGTISEFSATLLDVKDFALATTAAPKTLSNSIQRLFNSTNLLFGSSNDSLFSTSIELLSFGQDDPVIIPNTFSRQERLTNNNLLRTTVKVSALADAFLYGAEKEYETTQDLEDAQILLEEGYLDIRNNEIVSNEALEQLDNLRVDSYKVFDTKRVTSKSIVEIETPRLPLGVVAFNLYGNTDNVELLANLNNINQSGFVEGTLKVPV